MHAGLLRDVLTLAVGVVTGVLSAAFGVGGAVVSTPGIRALGATAFIAVGTTLPSILPSAAVSSISQWPCPGTWCESSDPPTEATMPAGAVHVTHRHSIRCSRR